MIDLSGSAVSGRRVLLYSNDTHGNGHLRQSLRLAGRLARHADISAVLVVAAAPSPLAAERPAGVDLITLPAAVEEGASYRSQTLGVALDELLRFRGNVIASVLASFGPDLMVVDDEPAGFEAELWPLFRRFAETRTRPRLVLGLRDVVDAADRVADEWSRLDAWRAVDRMYDRVLVYGDDTIATTATELRLDHRFGGRVRHVGYVSPALSKPDLDAPDERPLLLITDDDPTSDQMLDVYARFLSSSAVPSVELRVGDDTTRALGSARAVVTVADYPTVCEVLAAGVPALLVPRLGPAQEQALRAERLSAAAGVLTVNVADLTADLLHHFAATADRPASVDRPLTVNGLDVVAAEVGALLSQPASFSPAGPIEPSAEIRLAASQARRRSAPGTHRTGYLVTNFPTGTAPVVRHELVHLEQFGLPLHVVSLGAPDEEEGSPTEPSDRLAAPVTVIDDAPSSSLRTLFDTLDRKAGPDGARQARALLHRLPGPTGVRVLSQALEIVALLDTTGIARLHAHNMDDAAHAAFVVHVITGVPFTVTVHGRDVFRHNVDREAFAEVAAQAEAVITTSGAAGRHVTDVLLQGRSARVEVVPNIADVGDVTAPVGRTDRIGGFVLAVGSLEEKHGFHILVDACAHLLADGIDIGCAIVGEGPERSHLATRIRAAGVADRVRLAGALPRSQVFDLMCKATALAAPSVVMTDGDRTSLPAVLFEAMGRGTPVVTTPVGGVPELVEDGTDGIVVAPDDAGALASGLRLLLHERETWSRLSAAAAAKVHHDFDPAAMTARLAAILGHPTPVAAT